MRARLRGLAAAIGLLLLLGCATGSGDSGFLGDYSALQPGARGGARLVYLDAGVDFSGYERVIVEPVVVWKSDEARFAGVPAAQREALAREFEAELERALGEEFQVVEAPGPGTLRVRNALTAAIAGSGASDPRQLQYVEVELELLDAVTNERLAAAVDSKGSNPSRPHEPPHVVEAGAAFRDWAERLAVRLAALRAVDRHQRTSRGAAHSARAARAQQVSLGRCLLDNVDDVAETLAAADGERVH
jgi:hypothetical protein